jgi:hypothetical protein
MAGMRRVALLGNSVVASSLALTLRNRPDLEVLQLDTAAPEAAERLRDAHPDAIVLCEPAATTSDLIRLLLEENPGLTVVGVDGERAVVLSSRQASLWTEADLLQAIGQPRPLPPGAGPAAVEGESGKTVSAS